MISFCTYVFGGSKLTTPKPDSKVVSQVVGIVVALYRCRCSKKQLSDLDKVPSEATEINSPEDSTDQQRIPPTSQDKKKKILGSIHLIAVNIRLAQILEEEKRLNKILFGLKQQYGDEISCLEKRTRKELAARYPHE